MRLSDNSGTIGKGYKVFVPEDAVSSRTAENRLNALNQFRDSLCDQY